MLAGEERRENSDVTALIVYRLDQAEKRLGNLDDKVNNLSTGFVGLKAELEHVAKNEGKTSGAISGVITWIIAAGASVVFILNNSLANTTDTSIATSTNGNYDVKTTVTSGGVIYIKVTNISGVSLSEVLVISFTLIKGAIA